MGLQSRKLKGDTALEACLIDHSAHMTQGAVGEHFRKIQEALKELDKLNIDGGELSAKMTIAVTK